MNTENKPYFASHTDRGIQLERNDELNVYETDEEAIAACFSDALSGDVYALKQLILAAEDPLIRKYVGSWHLNIATNYGPVTDPYFVTI